MLIKTATNVYFLIYFANVAENYKSRCIQLKRVIWLIRVICLKTTEYSNKWNGNFRPIATLNVTNLENIKFVFLSAVQSLFRKFFLPYWREFFFFSIQNCKLKIFQRIFFINSYFVISKFCLSSLGEMFAASFFKKKIITNVMFESKTLFT